MSASERPRSRGWAVEVSKVLTERQWAYSCLDCGTHLLTAGEHPRLWLRARCGHLLLPSAVVYPYPRRWPCQACVVWLVRGEDNPEEEEGIDTARFCGRPPVALIPRTGPAVIAA